MGPSVLFQHKEHFFVITKGVVPVNLTFKVGWIKRLPEMWLDHWGCYIINGLMHDVYRLMCYWELGASWKWITGLCPWRVYLSLVYSPCPLYPSHLQRAALLCHVLPAWCSCFGPSQLGNETFEAMNQINHYLLWIVDVQNFVPAHGKFDQCRCDFPQGTRSSFNVGAQLCSGLTLTS